MNHITGIPSATVRIPKNCAKQLGRILYPTAKIVLTVLELLHFKFLPVRPADLNEASFQKKRVVDEDDV